jgi:two-component system chemotaxis response regulator CheB
MSDAPVSVLVVDDSALMRNLVGKIIEADEGCELAGKAMNGRFALQKLDSLKPEVIVLDLEMPEMNGIEFLQERRKRGIDIPVIILSSIAERGAKVTMEALALGASDFILKPSGSVSTDIHKVAEHLVELVHSLGHEYRVRHPLDVAARNERTATPTERSSERPAPSAPPAAPPTPPPGVTPGPIKLVAIGISTGGPNALRKVFALIPADLPCPIVVVQHMPPGFTSEFAKSLDRVCPMSVSEAADGDQLVAGHIYIAPGDHHVTVVRSGAFGRIHINQDPLRNGHRPSADVLFASVADHFRNEALGVIMTGMGKDGAKELGGIIRKGGLTIGQDAETSVVYGMPKVAYELGHVQRQVPLSAIADTITELVTSHQ